jgi:hypothetical protein
MDIDEALELLRDPKFGVVDLTGANVQQLKNKQAKRVLEPVLQKVLPRRQKGIEHSSYYRSLRVKLLPYNPYFKYDVANLRRLFHIPEGQIADLDLGQFPNRQKPWDEEELLPSARAAAYWLEIHRGIAVKKGNRLRLPPLPRWLIDSARTKLTFDNHAPLSWLEKKPDVPSRYAGPFNLALPIDRCVATLIERYQLPWCCDSSLRFFILTEDGKYLGRIFPLDVTVESIEAPIGAAFRIAVDSIDEYLTKQQWDEVFDRYIKPRQGLYWEERGELAHGKQMELKSLTKPWVTKLFRLIVEQRMAGRRMGVDRAIEQLSRNGKLSLSEESVDRTVAYRLVKNLDILCKPRD